MLYTMFPVQMGLGTRSLQLFEIYETNVVFGLQSERQILSIFEVGLLRMMKTSLDHCMFNDGPNKPGLCMQSPNDMYTEFLIARIQCV